MSCCHFYVAIFNFAFSHVSQQKPILAKEGITLGLLCQILVQDLLSLVDLKGKKHYIFQIIEMWSTSHPEFIDFG